MLRHHLAALVVLALVLPLVPTRDSAMACCPAGARGCECPIGVGFSRCDPAPQATPSEPPTAVLPSVNAFFHSPETERIAPPRADDVTAVLLELPDPVPRA